MTGEEMERAIELLLDQHAKIAQEFQQIGEFQAKTSVEIQRIGEFQAKTSVEIQRIGEFQAKTSVEIQRLGALQADTATDMQTLTGKVLELTDAVTRLETQAEVDREGMREAINNLIIANEVTRSLAEDVARLAINTSQRVTDLESNLP